MTLRSLNHRGGKIAYTTSGTDIMPGAGAHLLRIGFDKRADWLTGNETAQAIITGEVWSNNNPASPWVGSLIPQVVTLRAFGHDTWLAVQITDDQLVALDHARGGQPLNLRIDLKSTLFHVPEGFYGVAEDQSTWSVDEPTWLAMLDRVGVQTGLLIRVAGAFTDAATREALLATNDDLPSRAQAVLRLRQARNEATAQSWEYSVATCRRVLENVQQLGVSIPSAKSMKDKAPQTLNEDERWASLFHAVLALTQPAHHDDETALGFTFDRDKAETVLAATAGLLNVYAAKAAR